MRRVLKKIANDEHDLGDISTMADASVVEVGLYFIEQSFIFQVLFNCREEMMKNRKNK